PKAKLYNDYRVMLDKEKSIDAVNVTIPDFQHASATMAAMATGRHVYCQKPLAHTVWEARQVTLAARKFGVVTQMGNQGHSGEGTRQLCEMIWSGVIGAVREVHCWTDRPVGWWRQGTVRPPGADAVPDYLKWDLWLGPAPVRPYKERWPDADPNDQNPMHNVYCPFAWRGWWDFGCGVIGDMACHVMDGANWALKLGPPSTVEVLGASKVMPEMAPWTSRLKFSFPARGDMPECALYWYDGDPKNRPPRPAEMEGEWDQEGGSLFLGDKGKILSDCYGDNPRLLPESKMAEYTRPPKTIPRVPNNDNYLDFIRACKGGPAACSNFDVSGPFAETALLGNVALRVGKKLEWDSANLKCPNAPEADAFLKPVFREGWGFKA
ncbi:MAG: Gfo/Idh/MocA family protein, partial [Bryobacteraceae bacterium]